LKQTKQLIVDISKAGTDIIEIGVPFSDPLADGPTIQKSHHIALQQDASLTDVMEMVKQVRLQCVTPILLMGSLNLFLAYGLANVFKDAQDAGVDGFVVPDLPPEAAQDFVQLSEDYGLDLIFLASITSTPERLKRIAQTARGFIYLISSQGLTGERDELPMDDISETVTQLREHTDLPIAVGFGISNEEQASDVLSVSDGVIVGSAVVKRLWNSKGKAVKFIKKLHNTVEKHGILPR